VAVSERRHATTIDDAVGYMTGLPKHREIQQALAVGVTTYP
jgi:hypothetical protein